MRYKQHIPLKKRSRVIPWGFDISKDDPELLVPDHEALKLLDVAERAWKARTASQEDIAAWLAAKTGRPITRMGLKLRLFETNRKIRKRAKQSKKADTE